MVGNGPHFYPKKRKAPYHRLLTPKQRKNLDKAGFVEDSLDKLFGTQGYRPIKLNMARLNTKGFIGLFPLIAIGLVAFGMWLGNLDLNRDPIDLRSPECTMVGTFNQDGLAPPVTNDWHWEGYPNSQSKEAFLREYAWIKGILTKSFPGHEFKIVPHELHITRIVGWERIEGIYWRGHTLFKRPLRSA